MIGAGDRGRTGTIGKDRRILSPVRLPIPPLRQAHSHFVIKMAPREGLEPSTLRLTAACSTIELPRNTYYQQRVYHRQHRSLYPYQGKMSSIFFKYFTSILFFISYNPCGSSQSVYISGACKAYVRENLLRLCFQCQKFLIGSLWKMMRDDQFRHMILGGGFDPLLPRRMPPALTRGILLLRVHAVIKHQRTAAKRFFQRKRGMRKSAALVIR